MKTEKNILIAFILNLAFSIFEFFGGILTGSVAILSDAVHDIGDAASIGLSYFFEKKSKKQPDEHYTYGYARYSVLGSVITTLILLVGSVLVIVKAIDRFITPTEIDYNGMIIFGVFGVAINLVAAIITRHGDSLNQKAVNLHMLEDVLGWIVVLVGAIVMRFTDISVIDPIISIAVAAFIFINALKNLKEAIDLFLEKAPQSIDTQELKKHIQSLEGVLDVHHIHLWSIDGHNNYITMHVVVNGDHGEIKRSIRQELLEHGIGHATLELESKQDNCLEKHCHVSPTESHGHHHGHHHHH